MKNIGIIAEFNPFHNGHKYLIEKSKALTCADNVVIISSGNYVQRGTPAFIDKSIRSRFAIDNYADVVFELPYYYATASAELFARASVSFFEQLNCIDYLCFGCETENFDLLNKLSRILHEEPSYFKELLSQNLKDGYSFPKSRMNALRKYCSDNNISNEDEVFKILSSPNNILAIEYLKSLLYFNSTIKPIPIKRLGSSYDSTKLDEEYASATGIRNAISNNKLDSIKKFVPENCYEQMSTSKYITINDFNEIIGYKLLNQNDFTIYNGINEDLSNRINKYKQDFSSVETFIDVLKSKNYTYSAISRALLNIALDTTKEKLELFISNNYHQYARLLAFNKNSDILTIIKSNSKLDIISKMNDYYNDCSNISKDMLDMCIKADDIYRMIYSTKFNEQLPNEFNRQIYIKK